VREEGTQLAGNLLGPLLGEVVPALKRATGDLGGDLAPQVKGGEELLDHATAPPEQAQRHSDAVAVQTIGTVMLKVDRGSSPSHLSWSQPSGRDRSCGCGTY
jgi:hypothetical protein